MADCPFCGPVYCAGHPDDDPCWDGTDAAQPAWWRGQDDGVRAVVTFVTEALDGHRRSGTFGNPELEKLKQRLYALLDATC